MRAGGHGDTCAGLPGRPQRGRQRRPIGLLALLVSLFLVGVAGTASASPGAVAGAQRGTVALAHSAAWTLPQALPERGHAPHVTAPHVVGVVPHVAPARPAALATSYSPAAASACCRKTVPAWAGRAPPALL